LAGVPLFNSIVLSELGLQTAKFGLGKLEAALHRTVHKIFRYTERFRRGSLVLQTDRLTNRRTELR